MSERLPVMCPSSRCEEGHVLLGIVQADGKIGYLPERLEVDSDFVQIARQGRAPEKRFRFSSKCAESGCKQWTGSACGVIHKVLAGYPRAKRVSSPADCSIREQCRWHQQEGPKACTVCPLVITDQLVPEDAIAETAAAG